MKVREEKGKGPMRRIREAGMVPAILYGGGSSPLPLKVEYNVVERVLAKQAKNPILDLDIEGLNEKTLAMFKDIQQETISSKILHLDLLRISMDEKVEIEVKIVLVNEETVRKSSGIVQQLLNKAVVSCLPMDIPENIELDLSEAEIGMSYKVSDLKVPEGVEFMLAEDDTVLSILAPKVEEEPVVEEGEEGEAEEGAEGEEGEAKEGEESEGKDSK